MFNGGLTGVSEGQFQTVLDEELPKIRDACRRVSSNYRPSITLLIAGKRSAYFT